MEQREIRKFVSPEDVRNLVRTVENGDLFLMHDGRIFTAEVSISETRRSAWVHFRNIVDPNDSITDSGFLRLQDFFQKIGNAKGLIRVGGFEQFGDMTQWRRAKEGDPPFDPIDLSRPMEGPDKNFAVYNKASAAFRAAKAAAKAPGLDIADAKRSAGAIASLPPNPHKQWYRKLWPFDIERAVVVAIAIFVAWIAVDHFRQVNARIDAMRANAVNCGEARK